MSTTTALKNIMLATILYGCVFFFVLESLNILYSVVMSLTYYNIMGWLSAVVGLLQATAYYLVMLIGGIAVGLYAVYGLLNRNGADAVWRFM